MESMKNKEFITCKFCGTKHLTQNCDKHCRPVSFCPICTKSKVWLNIGAAQLRAKELGIDLKKWHKEHFYG